ncbi:MAG: hypothetical protein ACLFOY_07565 [Desulfatibacillaceae bacterium]
MFSGIPNLLAYSLREGLPRFPRSRASLVHTVFSQPPGIGPGMSHKLLAFPFIE